MVLSICGKCDLKKTLELLDRILPEKPLAPLPEKRYPAEKAECHRRFVRLYKDVSTPMIAIGIKVPPFKGSPLERIERFAALCVLAQALFSPGGRFAGQLKEQNLVPDEPSYELNDRLAFSHILFLQTATTPPPFSAFLTKKSAAF
jgi:predicted Zn-dependent peptidase